MIPVPPPLAAQERSMNFTKLVFPAALAGASLINTFAHAQTPIQLVAKVQRDAGKTLMKAWAADMRQIVDRQFGEARQKALMDRTARLSVDLKSLKACATNEDTDFLRSWLVSYRAEEKLPLELNYKPRCDFDNHVIVDGEVSIASFRGDLNVDDAVYSQAKAMKDVITAGITKWAAEERAAIDAIKDRPTLTGKVADITKAYQAKFQNTPCHQGVPFDFAHLAEQEKKKQTLPIQLEAGASCEGGRLGVRFEAQLDTKILDFKPTIDPKSTTWAATSAEIFREANSLSSDDDKKRYAAKFGSNGTYGEKLNSILCADMDAVRSGLAKKAQELKSNFSFAVGAVNCVSGHLSVSLRVDVVKKK
jgi:hypothetical protein